MEKTIDKLAELQADLHSLSQLQEGIMRLLRDAPTHKLDEPLAKILTHLKLNMAEMRESQRRIDKTCAQAVDMSLHWLDYERARLDIIEKNLGKVMTLLNCGDPDELRRLQ